MSNNKSKIIWFLICPLLFFIFVIYFICVAYFYDPLQLFSEKYPNRYIIDSGLSTKRAIDNYEFDSIILGTSMFHMTNPKELKNGKYINITIGGSTMEARSYIFDYLFQHYNVLNAITTLDYVTDGFGEHKNFSNIYKSDFNFIKKIFLYMNGNVDYKCFFSKSLEKECIGEKHNYYDINLEFKGKEYEFNVKDFKTSIPKKSLVYEPNILNKYLFKYIKENPNTNFHIIIPPYHILYYKDELYKLIELYKYTILNTIYFKNVKIYFFGNEKFSDNINNYFSDKYHYKSWINSRINKAINEGTNIITVDNMDEEFDKFIKKVENYDIKAYEEALKLDIRE